MEAQTSALLDSRTIQVRLGDVNEHFICKLCKGYLRDAQAIKECLHTFCNGCIRMHFEQERKARVRTYHCPVCRAELGVKPHLQLIPDPAIQDLIRKFSLHDPVKEAEEEREFYRRLGIKRKASSTRKNTTPTKIRRTSSEGSAQKIQFELQPRKSDVPLYFLLEPLRNPNMRTDPTLKIMYLKKYIAMKLRLDTPDEVAILCKGTSVGAEYSLEFVRRTVWQDEGQKMRLEFHRQLV